MTTATTDWPTVWAKVTRHPVRRRITDALKERGEASPSELAEVFGERLGNVSYHFRTLLDLDVIELVRTTPRRGAVEHHYRLNPAAMKRSPLDAALELRRCLWSTQGALDAICTDMPVSPQGFALRGHIEGGAPAMLDLIDAIVAGLGGPVRDDDDLSAVMDRGMEVARELANDSGLVTA